MEFKPLTDEQWTYIAPLLPPRVREGKPRAGDGQAVNAIPAFRADRKDAFESKVLAVLRDTPNKTVEELSRFCEVNDEGLKSHLEGLERIGILSKDSAERYFICL